MHLHFSIIKNEGMYIGSVKEYPGVLTQGRTVAETKANLLDALKLYLKYLEDNERKKTQTAFR